jgi:hypothetical protein
VNVTLDEARTGATVARWFGTDDEFLLDPGHGVVLWRPVAAGRMDLLRRSWRMVPEGMPVPRDGWTHDAGPEGTL